MAPRRASSRTPLALARAFDAHCDRLAACRRCALGPDVMPIVSMACYPGPHPSGASTWMHVPEHCALLERSLQLLRGRLGLPNVTARSVA